MDQVLKKQLKIWMDLINQEKELLHKEVDSLRSTLVTADLKLKETEQSLGEMTQKIKSKD